MGALGVVLVAFALGSAMVGVYATPLTTQDKDQTRDRDCLQDRDQLRERECLKNRDQLGDQFTCPNFIDEDGDGICDNCPRESGIEAMAQYMHGWEN